MVSGALAASWGTNCRNRPSGSRCEGTLTVCWRLAVWQLQLQTLQTVFGPHRVSVFCTHRSACRFCKLNRCECLWSLVTKSLQCLSCCRAPWESLAVGPQGGRRERWCAASACDRRNDKNPSCWLYCFMLMNTIHLKEMIVFKSKCTELPYNYSCIYNQRLWSLWSVFIWLNFRKTSKQKSQKIPKHHQHKNKKKVK